jgi:CheY-like chemotaxis protein
MKLLIVEDQKWTLMSLKAAVDSVMPAYFPGFSKKDYDIAKWYADAEQKISQNSYDIVLLDHRMPYDDVGDLEETDMKKFSASLENIGYSLVKPIKKKNPKAIVIGTSSMKPEDIRGFQAPDYRLDKLDAEKELDRIMKELKGKGLLV